MSVLLFGALCITFSAIVGGATGFGSALVATPLMLLAGFPPPQVVVLNLAVGVISRLAATYQLRTEINWRRVALLALGSIPGAWLGAVTVAALPEQGMKLVVGWFVVVSGIAMALPTRREVGVPSSTALTLTGAAGGYLGTTTSLSGPPPVLLLMRSKIGPLSFIADLAGYFVVANSMALLILWINGTVAVPMVWPSLPIFAAAALLGNVVGLWIARRLETRVFRAAVVVLVVATGFLTVATA